ncbi:MAG: hypothetical protein ABW221_27535 [Vicinamibacteria bacterium]
MRPRLSFVRHGAAVLACALLPACGHLGAGKVAPPQHVDMDPGALREFQEEVEEYVELHQDLLKRVPNVSDSATAAEMDAHRKKMADAIRAERRSAKQGDIFEPRVAAAFVAAIRKELAGPEGAAMLQEIRAGNPRVEGTPRQNDPSREDTRNVALAINLAYPDGAPSSSVPSSLLLALPRLPEQVKYGFIGRALVLRETEADLILDFVRDVVPDPGLPR